MNINSLQAALAQASEVIPDGLPGLSASGNTTVGSGLLPVSLEGIVPLVVTQAATQEERTLNDPDKPGITLMLVLYSTAGAQVSVTASSGINAAGNTHVLFTAANQSVMLRSIPFAGNAKLARWQVVYNNGASLS